MNYSKDRDNCAHELYENVKDTDIIQNALIPDTPMPVSLKVAHNEYQYGIFTNDSSNEQQNS